VIALKTAWSRLMPRKRRQTARDPDDDPLGKLIQQYRVNLAGVLLLAGVVALIGLGLLAFALTRKPHLPMVLVAGALVMVVAFALVAINTFNVGRRLELRKHGVRFVESGMETELAWDEIADIEVSRLDHTSLGPVGIWKRSSDASTPSGPLTNTEFTVIIHGQDGRRIRLSPIFLRGVSDPRKLISQLRLRAGLR
jgi:hypothetical protein